MEEDSVGESRSLTQLCLFQRLREVTPVTQLPHLNVVTTAQRKPLLCVERHGGAGSMAGPSSFQPSIQQRLRDFKDNPKRLGTHSFIHSFKQQIFTKFLLRFRLCAWSLQGRRGERGGCRAPDQLELLLGNTSVSVPAAPHLNSGYPALNDTHLAPAVTMLGLEERVSSACF